jgi:cell division protein FtsZ
MGVRMQPMSYDSYKRDTVPEPWVEKAPSREIMYEEHEDQWAVLRHEVEEEEMQRPNEQTGTDWEQRDTEESRIAAPVPFDVPAQNAVDIVVVGVGGGGMNAVSRMISAHVRGVRFVVMNTDAQVLALSDTPSSICLGEHYTKGLGAGGNSAVGMRAANESSEEIRAALGGADLVFIAAGMGGGTGTGAAPVVASIAKKLGALTIGIVTLPFSFEGTRRRRIAEQGLHELSNAVDALITVPNDRLLSTSTREQSLVEAFKVADDVLRQGVQGIAEVINVPGMVNVDFADVRSVLRDAGTALMSIGQGRGRSRAQQAAEEAVAGGFLNVTIRGAKRVLFNISGGEDMTLYEVNEVAERIGAAIDDAADITFGAVIDPGLKETLRVTLIAAGMEELHTTQLHAVRLERPHPYHTQSSGTGSLPVQGGPAAPSPRTATGGSKGREMPPSGPPATRLPPPVQPPVQQPNPGARPQRSLNDLRGIRSIGKRYEQPKGLRERNAGYDNEDAIDVPPFLKRHE